MKHVDESNLEIRTYIFWGGTYIIIESIFCFWCDLWYIEEKNGNNRDQWAMK